MSRITYRFHYTSVPNVTSEWTSYDSKYSVRLPYEKQEGELWQLQKKKKKTKVRHLENALIICVYNVQYVYNKRTIERHLRKLLYLRSPITNVTSFGFRNKILAVISMQYYLRISQHVVIICSIRFQQYVT